LHQIEKIKEISITIAQMDLSDKITAYHVAEAIQYNVIDKNCIFAESKEISFNNQIHITLNKIDPETIQKAINYLNELLLKTN
jgi:hypothetical protein